MTPELWRNQVGALDLVPLQLCHFLLRSLDLLTNMGDPVQIFLVDLIRALLGFECSRCMFVGRIVARLVAVLTVLGLPIPGFGTRPRIRSVGGVRGLRRVLAILAGILPGCISRTSRSRLRAGYVIVGDDLEVAISVSLHSARVWRATSRAIALGRKSRRRGSAKQEAQAAKTHKYPPRAMCLLL